MANDIIDLMLIDDNKSQATAHYKNGYTLKKIAEIYECNPETVSRRLIEWGVPRRHRGWWSKGKKKTAEHRKKLRKHLDEIRPLAIKAVKEGKRRSYDGKKNPKWRGGGTTYFKQKVLARDGRVCQMCGYDEHPEIIEVHHIDGDHKNSKLENGMAVCPNCHRIEEFRKKTFHTQMKKKNEQ